MDNVYHHKLEIFNSNLVLVTKKESFEEFVKSLEIDYEEHFGGMNCLGLFTTLSNKELSKTYYVICIFDDSKQTLVHECCHASFIILGDKGVPTKAGKANETFCYMTDFIYGVFKGRIKND